MAGTGVLPRMRMELDERTELDRFADVRSSVHPMDHDLVRVEFVVAMCAANAPILMLFKLDQSCADPQKLCFCGSDCAIQKGNGIVDLARSF